jgi:hypothetical protein
MKDGSRMSPWLEQAWLQRYLARELAADETEWFEVYLLDKPHLVQAIEADTDLRVALNDAAGIFGEEAALPLDTPAADARARPPGEPVLRASHARPRRRIGFALAASLVAGATLGWMLATTAPPPGAMYAAGPTRLVYDTWRGAAAAPQVHPGSRETPYVLVEVGLPPDATDVRLRAASGETPLTVSSEGFASFLWRRDAKSADSPIIEFTSAGQRQKFELSLDPTLLETAP